MELFLGIAAFPAFCFGSSFDVRLVLSLVVGNVLVPFFLSFFFLFLSSCTSASFLFLSFFPVMCVGTIGKWRKALASGCSIQRDCSFHLLRILLNESRGMPDRYPESLGITIED